MQKAKFKKLALMGITGGIILAAQAPASLESSTDVGCTLAAGCGKHCRGASKQIAESCGSRSSPQEQYRTYTAEADVSVQKQSSKQLSEGELMNQLKPETQAVFKGMSPEGKALALKLANQTCKGKNDCKGLNSCQTADSTCAGRGSCKGTSPGPFKDKNEAVKIAAKKMAEKRSSMNQGQK